MVDLSEGVESLGVGRLAGAARLPERLVEGATVGVIALSSPVAASVPRRLARAISELEARGFSVREAPSVLRRLDSFRSAPPADRAAEPHDFFRNDEVSVVLSAIGGYATIEVLPYLDLELIARHPKLLVGYSDTGVLQAGLWQAVALVSVSGPALLPQFGDAGGIDAFTFDALWRVVSRPVAPGRLPHPEDQIVEFPKWDVDDDRPRLERRPRPLAVLRPGAACGPLIPVNIESLLALAGTSWFPSLDGAVVVLEASDGTGAARFRQQLATCAKSVRSDGWLALHWAASIPPRR